MIFSDDKQLSPDLIRRIKSEQLEKNIKTKELKEKRQLKMKRIKHRKMKIKKFRRGVKREVLI